MCEMIKMKYNTKTNGQGHNTY